MDSDLILGRVTLDSDLIVGWVTLDSDLIVGWVTLDSDLILGWVNLDRDLAEVLFFSSCATVSFSTNVTVSNSALRPQERKQLHK